MRFDIMIFTRRFLELFLTNFIISGFTTILHLAGIIGERKQFAPVLIIGAVIFFVLNARMLKFCYYDMRRNTRMYYILNIVAYLLFAFVGFVVYVFGTSSFYTWLFAITKFIRFTANGVSTFYSALFFHFIGLSLIFFVPMSVKIAYSADDIK